MMCKKHFFAAGILLCFFSTISFGDLPIAVEDKFNQSRDAIIALIKSGQTATSSIDKLAADFPQEPKLAETLCWFAEEYGYADKRDEEKRLYQQIIQQYPGSVIAEKARLGYSSADVRTFIVSQEYDKAKEAIDKLIADFNSHPDLPDVLYRLARCFEWQDRYGQAKDIFQYITDNYPDSGKFDKARLGLCRMNICSSIVAKKFEAAQDEFNKVMMDFSSHPDLPDTLGNIARRYEFSDRYKEANSIYERIITNWPDSSYANKAKFDIQRAQIKAIIAEQDKTDANPAAITLAAADETIDKFIADFNGNPDMPEALYWIAQRYGYSGNWEEEKELYQYVQENYAGSLYADRARVDSAGADVLTLAVSQDDNEVNSTLEKMAADFNSHSYLANAMIFMADKCHDEALRIGGVPEDGNKPLTNRSYPLKRKLYSFVIEMLKKYIFDGNSIKDKYNEAEACYRAAVAAYRLGEVDKTIDFADNLLQNEPNFRYAANMEWLIADGYEQLRAAGQIPAKEADAIIEEAYERLMDKYPGTEAGDYAATHMGFMNLLRRNYTKACAYFCWYLMNGVDDDVGRMAVIEKMIGGSCRQCGGCGRPQRKGGNNND